VLIPALSSNVGPVVVLSSADFGVTRSGYLPYAQGFASLSLPITRPHISPRVISYLDAQSITRIPTVHAHDDTLDLNIPITIEVSRRSSLSKSPAPTPDIAADSLRPVDNQEGPGPIVAMTF
jgi:hypothetical protein